MPVSQGGGDGFFFDLSVKIAGLFSAFVIGIVSATWAVAIKFHGITAKQEDHEKRLDDIESQPVITIEACKLTRAGCGRANDIQVTHGTEMFKELKEDIREIKGILREMNQ